MAKGGIMLNKLYNKTTSSAINMAKSVGNTTFQTAKIAGESFSNLVFFAQTPSAVKTLLDVIKGASNITALLKKYPTLAATLDTFSRLFEGLKEGKNMVKKTLTGGLSAPLFLALITTTGIYEIMKKYPKLATILSKIAGGKAVSTTSKGSAKTANSPTTLNRILAKLPKQGRSIANELKDLIKDLISKYFTINTNATERMVVMYAIYAIATSLGDSGATVIFECFKDAGIIDKTAFYFGTQGLVDIMEIVIAKLKG